MAGLALLDRLEPGDHVCWTVDDDEIRLDAIAGLVAAGVRERHRVIYCGDAAAALLARLAANGLDIRIPVASGQLRAESAESAYLVDGVFDPETTIARWEHEKDWARAEGYRGMRVVGDMTWALRPAVGTDRLDWYEAQVNTLFTDGYVMGVCAYDQRCFDPVRLRRLSLAHPAAAGPLLPFDPDTSLRIRRTEQPYGLWLSGEADTSNRQALRVTLEEAFRRRAREPVVTVDATALRFADSAAVRVLLHTAVNMGPMQVVGCSPMLVRLLRFHGAGEVPGLRVTAGYQ